LNREPVTPKSGSGAALRSLLHARDLGILASLLLVCLAILLAGSRAREAFLSALNLQNLSRHLALLGIFALGEAVVIIAGGIDLSVGSLISLTGVVAALLMARAGVGVGLAIAVALGMCLLVGLWHSLLIARLGLPPFIATLGSLCVLRGAALLLTEAVPVPIVAESFVFLGNGRIAGVPVPLLFLVPVAAGVWVLMRCAAVGRYLYALGGNEEAARLSGINVARIKAFAYCLCALLTGLAGILYAGYDRQGNPSSGVTYELNAIAAAVIGGCSLAGGQGSIVGTLIGAAILSVIINGLNLIIRKNASLWEGVIVGLVVVSAVALTNLREGRR